MNKILFKNIIVSAKRSSFMHLLNNIHKSEKVVRNARLLVTLADNKIMDFHNEKLQNFLESLRKEFYTLRTKISYGDKEYTRMAQLSDIIKLLEEHRALQGNMPSQKDIEAETDPDMQQLIKEEIDVYRQLVEKAECELMQKILILADTEYYPSLMLEINAGAGGQEAMLFAKELYDMYIKFLNNNNWDYEIMEEDSTDIGGLRHAMLIVNDDDSYKFLRYEAGVHRVQRVPTTDRSGRIHTSTASVAVIPRPSDANIVIANKDLKIETKRASGAGGQHVNTTDSAVRIVHIPTGISTESQSERSQIKNKEIALKKLHAKLLQIELQSSEASTKATRKAQQGNLDRNEKIRTYNFAQDRITDHRIQGGTVHNLNEFLEGGDHLASLIQKIAIDYRKRRLVEMVENWKEK